MKVIFLAMISSFLIQTPVAHAYRMVIFTDESNPKKALQVIEEFRSTYPFNKFEIEFQIAKAKPEQLNCSSHEKAKRMVQCSQSIQAINIVTQKMGGDQALIVKDMNFHGGSAHVGAGTPVMTTGAAKNTMIHEYLHTLGLCDEYIYEAEIANDYCQATSSQAMNKAFIEPLSSYANDQDARNKHSQSIKWFSNILGSTPITNSNGKKLGTATDITRMNAPVNRTGIETRIDTPVGLYPSGVCKNATTGVKTWKPSGSITIMENLNAGLGKPLEQIVERLLLSRGMRLKPEYRNTHAQALPQAAVEDSSRSIIKKYNAAPMDSETKQEPRGVAR